MTDTSQPPPVAWADPQRKSDFERWLAPLAQQHGLQPQSLRAASADASFRRYLRIDRARGASLVVMDAPPPQEDVRPFVKIAQSIQQAGLHGPEVLAADVERGFLLLTDLGRTLYLDAFADASPKPRSCSGRPRCPATACRRTTRRCCAVSCSSSPTGASCANAA
jgi:N-acetylmuramate 1-kinase